LLCTFFYEYLALCKRLTEVKKTALGAYVLIKINTACTELAVL